MNPTIVGMIVFACTFGGALLGMWSRTALPEHHFDAESRGTAKAGIGLIATMAALEGAMGGHGVGRAEIIGTYEKARK